MCAFSSFGDRKIKENYYRLEERRTRINAEIQRVKGREQQAERKRETRRKILVGSDETLLAG